MPRQPEKVIQGENQRLISVMEKALLASFLEHSIFIPLFIWLGIWEMVGLNVFSTSLLGFCLYLRRKGYLIPVYLLTISEVILHAFAAVYFIGWSSGFHYYIIVLIPFIYFWPFWKYRLKVITSIFLFFIYSSLFLFSQLSGSKYQLTFWQSNLTNLFNIFNAFTAFAAVAWFYQSSVKTAEIDLKKANTRLEELARTDPLTDLHNRRMIFEKMREEENNQLIAGKRFSIIMADIDHFKLLNDQYGHQFGDLVLISLANMLKGTTRSKDVVARWGGEEFLVLLPETGGNEAKDVADRMRTVISQTPIFIDGKEIHLSMTFGVAECTSDVGINTCISLADKALYKGKENGRDQVVLHEAIPKIELNPN